MTPGHARAVYRVLLRIAPPSLRERHGEEMEDVFLDAVADAAARGRWAVGWAWVHAVRDLVDARITDWTRSRTLRRAIDERKGLMLGSDVRYAFRSLRRQKLATALVIGMLSLAIAANVAVFSLVNGLFLRPFPFPDPDRLVSFNETAPKWNLDVVGISYADFDQWRKGVRLFEAIAVYDGASFNVAGEGAPDRIAGARVTYEMDKVLGIMPLLGRMFTAQEDKPKAGPVVVIGEGIWRERYGMSHDVIGRTLRLDGVSRTIIGVLPASADFGGSIKLWVPLAEDPANRGSYSFSGIGRMKSGVSVAEAERDLLRAHQPIWDSDDKDRIVSPFARNLRDDFVRDFTGAASTLTVAVTLLLLIACANVASIMLARALVRRREMGIRLALGAGRLRLVQQLLVENLMMAAVGGAIGLVAGQWALRLLLTRLPDELPKWAAFYTDFRVMAFAVLTVVGTVIVFGWAPAIHALRGDLRSAVHATTAAATASPRGRGTLWILVGAEFALAALLLTCGGLLFRAFDRVRRVDPGFRTDHLLTFSIALPDASYDTPEKRLAFWESLVAQLESQPGVESAGAITCAPLGCHWGYFLVAEGAVRKPTDPNPVTLVRWANASYAKTVGLRLRSGRFFDDHDGRDKDQRVVIVNETFAKTFWPDGSSPVGRRVKMNGDKNPWFTIVGLVGDVKHYGLERPMRPGIYLPLPSRSPSSMTVVMRTAPDPQSLASAARAVVGRLDQDLPMYQVRSMDEALRRSTTVRAAYSWMLAVFASLALILALGGAYGVASYLVTQRTREIGIRVALGARSRDIVRTVVGRGLVVAAAGVTLGIGASMGVARLLADLLFGVSTRDVTILTGVAIVLAATALVANGVPAWRASQTNPMRSLLRTE